jgi:hypothetical protein
VLADDETAKAIRATRADFSNLFLQAQVGLPVRDRVGFEAVARSADDRQAFAEALAHARLKGWLNTLIDAIIAAGLDDGHLAEDFSRSTGNAELQAMVNTFRGFLQPHVVLKGLDNAMRWTGKILIDGQPQGTGILIANDLLLTAWHVVRQLFNPAQGGGYEPEAAAGLRIGVLFDDFLQVVGRGQGLQGRGQRHVKTHAEWCLAHSECHADEMSNHLPTNLVLLEGFWDYAIIRLAEPIGFERGWATLDARAAVPVASGKIVLLQYPSGQTMRLDFDDVAAAAASQQLAIPRFRFLHYVNALPGSSGGPCFDKSFTFFGFHQGQWEGGGTRATNRGVPIVRVLEHIETKYGGLRPQNTSTSLIWKLGPEQGSAPVIGCDEFQQEVLQSAVLGKPRLFTLTGEKGSGKTFQVRVLSAMLSDADHIKIHLDAAAISKMDAVELAKVICTGAGGNAPSLESASEVHSTTAVWLKDEVVRKVIEELNRVRGGRLVWVCITELDAFDIEGDNSSQLLLLLYEEVLRLEWLRVVLDGMKGDIPASLRELQYRHRVREITRGEIETYFNRLATQMSFDLGVWTQLESLRLYQKYDTDLINDRQNATRNLSSEVLQTARNLLQIVNTN